MPTKQSSDLTSLMNVGAAVAGYLGRAGITQVDDLAGRDPFDIYQTICDRDGVRHDPCLLDTIMSATDQANGKPGRPWWSYTPERNNSSKGSVRRIKTGRTYVKGHPGWGGP